MSSWTYIFGSIEVSPIAYSEHAARFVLEEVLDHLPVVSGSEYDMDWSIEPVPGKNSWSSHDEFGQYYDQAFRYSNHTHSYDRTLYGTQHNFMIHLHGNFRDRLFEETLKEFTRWISRLSTRVLVEELLVKVYGNSKHNYDYKEFIFSDASKFEDNYRSPSYIDSDFTTIGEFERLQDGRYLDFSTQYGQDVPWVEKLLSLFPVGIQALHESDVLHGHSLSYNEEDYKRYVKSVINIAIGAKIKSDNKFPKYHKDDYDYSDSMTDEEYSKYLEDISEEVCKFFNYSDGRLDTNLFDYF